MIKKQIIKIPRRKLKTCKIVHKKTGLFFNGYDGSFSQGKNTLSLNNFKSFLCKQKSDNEILEMVFNGKMISKSDGLRYIKNIIIYKGSEIHKVLSEHYKHYDYIPLKDFYVERNK